MIRLARGMYLYGYHGVSDTSYDCADSLKNAQRLGPILGAEGGRLPLSLSSCRTCINQPPSALCFDQGDQQIFEDRRTLSGMDTVQQHLDLHNLQVLELRRHIRS